MVLVALDVEQHYVLSQAAQHLRSTFYYLFLQHDDLMMTQRDDVISTLLPCLNEIIGSPMAREIRRVAWL